MKHLSLFLVALLTGRLSLGRRAQGLQHPRGVDIACGVHGTRGVDIAYRVCPGRLQHLTRRFPQMKERAVVHPMIESPEIGVDYDVYLSLHCGYADSQRVGFGGRLWRFTENGSDLRCT